MRQILIAAICLSFLKVTAQPNLVVSYTTPPQPSISLGNYLTFAFRIKNVGTSTPYTSHVSVYLSSSTSFSNAVKLNDISIQALSANTETQNINYVFPIPYKFSYGNYYVMILPDSRHEVVGNTNNLVFYNTSTTDISSNGAQQSLPYPIILIHGWGGNDKTWYPFLTDVSSDFGYSYGGNMDFCLNQDNNLSTSYLPTDFKDWTDTTKLIAGDFYTVNFDIDANGIKYDSTSESSQSAAVKQGVAIQKAVQHVLAVTGRQKVILVAHSMGGLAAREYLQNTYDWQPDGQHHVAKLHTLGTPHGGSNATTFNFSLFEGMDETSEAVRDLRESYDISGSPGVYLYGGVESYGVMDNSLFENYRNVDVNCNGVSGNTIIGLNQKNLYTNLDYSCTIGIDTYPFTECIGSCDGVVGTYEANLNNYYNNLNADTFVCVGKGYAAHPFHLDEPQKTSFIFQGIDEPYKRQFAYEIDTAKYYFGHFTVQSLGDNTVIDSDYYKFSLSQNGYLKLEVFNIPVPYYGIKIIDSSTNVITNIFTNGTGYLDDSGIAINEGTYFVNVYGLPDASAWLNPYALKLSYTCTGICPLSNVIFDAGITGTNYQWQVDTGNGFANIHNSIIYSGVTTPSLQLTSPLTNWYGYKYRCTINGNTESQTDSLKFSTNWTGSINTDWENSGNWSCGILPDANTDVYINSGVVNYPKINNKVDVCRSLHENNGTIITITPNNNLNITGH